MGAVRQWRDEENDGEEWMACFCQSELGDGYVYFQVAS